MYCGLWIERRARKLGLKVHVTCSRDRDEILRHYDMSLDRMEALLIEHPELDKELPCVRDVEKAHSRLFSYKYASHSNTAAALRHPTLSHPPSLPPATHTDTTTRRDRSKSAASLLSSESTFYCTI